MSLWKHGLGVVGASFRSFLLVNFVYFGLVGCGMTYGSWNPDVHQRLAGNLRTGAKQGLPAVVAAYGDGHFFRAVAWTLGINLMGGAFLYITLPSLAVPMAGLVTGSLRAVTWGLIFTPSLARLDAVTLSRGALIGLLLLLEGSGYVLAMFGSFLHGRALLRPASVGATGRWDGYKIGACQSLALYPLIVTTLTVAAVYEATILILVLPTLK
ncbi:MAG TPA: hypothetical protein VGN12_01425 [Pirellulales bacterium]|jgi:hypothetical protein